MTDHPPDNASRREYQRRINRQREELNALSVRFDYLQNSSLAIFCLTALFNYGS